MGRGSMISPLSDELTNAKCNVDVVQHVIIIMQVSAAALLSILWCLSLLRVAKAERN